MRLSLGHRVSWTRGAFSHSNEALLDVFSDDRVVPRRVLVVLDSGVREAVIGLEEQISAWFSRHTDRLLLASPVQVVAGGESIKNSRSAFESMLVMMHDAKLCRQSYVLAIGGGAVLDAVGLAAALTHRGVRLVRMPTTTMSQGDSGVAVKNGVNAFGKKNFLGCFAVPWAVVNDESLLTTLSDRDWISGLSEAVKVAVIKDRGLFETIERDAGKIAKRDFECGTAVLRRSAQLHLSHIVDGGDPFEVTNGRPLDMGHWAAHKLESMSGFSIRHGEAVAIGLAIDATYAAIVGVCDSGDARRIVGCLDSLGFTLASPLLKDADTLMQGLSEFQEHLGGELAVALPTGIGSFVDARTIDALGMRKAILSVADRGERSSRDCSGEREQSTISI